MPAVEPFVTSPVPMAAPDKLTPLLDAPPAIVLPPVPPPLIPPPKLRILPNSLAPGRGRAELPAIIEIGSDEGGTGGNDRGV